MRLAWLDGKVKLLQHLGRDWFTIDARSARPMREFPVDAIMLAGKIYASECRIY